MTISNVRAAWKAPMPPARVNTTQAAEAQAALQAIAREAQSLAEKTLSKRETHIPDVLSFARGLSARLLSWGRRAIDFVGGLFTSPLPAAPTSPAQGVPALPLNVRVIEVALGGGVDAAAALQRAIDSLGPAGGVVRLPAGNFALNKAITLKSNVHVAGVPGQTVLSGAGHAVFTAQGVADVSIRDLTIDGGQYGLRAAKCQRVGVYGCEIRNLSSNGPFASGTGLMFDSAVTGARIIGNYIHDCGSPDSWSSGMRLAWGSSDAVVTDNRISRVARNGIAANDGSRNLLIARNTVTDMLGETALGIELWNDCSGTVEDNKLSGWLSFDGSTGVIRRNTVDGSWNPRRRPSFGIEVVAGDGVRVTDNVVRNVGLGLSIDKTRRSIFSNNLIERVGTGAQGYGRDKPADGNTLSANTFRDGSGRGVFLNEACDNWRIEGNVIERFDASGIYIMASDGATLSGNTVRQTATKGGSEAAIYWNQRPENKTRLTLKSNVLEGNGENYVGVPAAFMPR